MNELLQPEDFYCVHIVRIGEPRFYRVGEKLKEDLFIGGTNEILL